MSVCGPSSSKPDKGGHQRDECAETARKLVVACGDAAKLLQSAKETFDKVAALVMLEIQRSLLTAVGFRRNDRFGPDLVFDVSQDLVCVVGLIGRNTPGAGRVRSFKQRAGLSAVVSLAAGQHPPAQVAQPLDQSVNPRRQAASRAPNGLVPFF